MRLYNTLTGKKEDFAPSGVVRIYVCGVTPYDACHIGHALSYIIFDVLRRYLEFRGHQVRHVQNFTDVDDKIIARAARLGVSAQELAERQMAAYFEDMERLNIQRAAVYPRATQEIPRIIELVQGLLDKGHAYRTAGGIYFRVLSFPTYGKLSHRTLESLQAGARVEVDPDKEHPADFALWKAAQPGEPFWESPWGPGRPGWHIECSAMSLRYLGETLDIHGGGQDLIFPHHENEIAQSEAFTGVEPFARFWVHNGLLQLGQEKMSKSLGNLITVKDFLSRHAADALRLLVLSSHYRVNLVYTEEAVAAAERGVERLRLARRAAGESKPGSWAGEEYRARFIEAMDDDLNTPQAVAALFDLARELNSRRESQDVAPARALLRGLAGVLGLTLEASVTELDPQPLLRLATRTGAELREVAPAVAENFQARLGDLTRPPVLGPGPIIGILTDARAELRQLRQWAYADQIRARLRELGVVLEDTPQGTVWRYLPRSYPETPLSG